MPYNTKIWENFGIGDLWCDDLNVDLSEKYLSSFLMFFASFLTFFRFVSTLPRSRVRHGALDAPGRACSAPSTGTARMHEGTRHKIIVWSTDLTQYLFEIDSIQLMIQSGFSKNESIRLMIQAVMKTMIQFNS